MVLDEDDVEVDIYEDYYNFIEKYSRVITPVTTFYRHRGRAQTSVKALTTDKFYLIFFFNTRHWQLGKFKLPRLSNTYLTLDRFSDNSSGNNAARYCLFFNSTYNTVNYLKDWYAVRVI